MLPVDKKVISSCANNSYPSSSLAVATSFSRNHDIKLPDEEIHYLGRRVIERVEGNAHFLKKREFFEHALQGSIALMEFVITEMPNRAQAIESKVLSNSILKGVPLDIESLKSKVHGKIFKLCLKIQLSLAVYKMVHEKVANYTEESNITEISETLTANKAFLKLFNPRILIQKRHGQSFFYIVAKKIDRGAFNTVSLVFNIMKAEKIAFRELELTGKAQELLETRIASWKEEVKIHKKIKKILGGLAVQLKGVLKTKERVGLFLEYCEEGTLERAWLSKNNDEKKILLIDVLKALNSMHTAGYVYGDVKQNNFLVHQGRGKIADFGTTFHMAKPPIFTSGSPMFRSPESLLLNNRPNFGIDIWAFGIMAFCLKYRFPPPFANKQNQILRQVSPKAYTNNFFENYIRPLVENGIDELRSFLDLQNSFDQLIHDCLIIDPKERLTAAQAITRLEEMHGQCIATPPIKETLMKLGYIDERLGVEEAKKLLFSLMPQACQRVCIFIQEQGENFVIWINPQNQSLYHSAYSIISHEGEEKISIELLNKKAFSLDDLVSWMLPNRFNSVI